MSTADWKLKATVNSLPHNAFSIGAIRKFESNVYPINDRVIIGRDQAFCDYTLPWKHISRQHTEIKVIGEGLEVKDLGSGNGTFINGKPVDVGIAHPGDIISFDRVSLIVHGPNSSPDTPRPVPLDSQPIEHTIVRPIQPAAKKAKTKTTAKGRQPNSRSRRSNKTNQSAANDYSFTFTFTLSGVTFYLLKGMLMGLGIATAAIGIHMLIG